MTFIGSNWNINDNNTFETDIFSNAISIFESNIFYIDGFSMNGLNYENKLIKTKLFKTTIE